MNNRSANEIMQKQRLLAEDHYKKGEYVQAIECYTYVINKIETTPNLAARNLIVKTRKDDLYYARGLAFRAIDRYEEAVEDFEEAIRNKPLPEYFYRCGEAKFADAKKSNSLSYQRKHLQSAVQYVKKANLDDPSNVIFINTLIELKSACHKNVSDFQKLNDDFNIEHKSAAAQTIGTASPTKKRKIVESENNDASKKIRISEEVTVKEGDKDIRKSDHLTLFNARQEKKLVKHQQTAEVKQLSLK